VLPLKGGASGAGGAAVDMEVGFALPRAQKAPLTFTVTVFAPARNTTKAASEAITLNVTVSPPASNGNRTAVVAGTR
jgi:hypothetical protein